MSLASGEGFFHINPFFSSAFGGCEFWKEGEVCMCSSPPPPPILFIFFFILSRPILIPLHPFPPGRYTLFLLPSLSSHRPLTPLLLLFLLCNPVNSIIILMGDLAAEILNTLKALSPLVGTLPLPSTYQYGTLAGTLPPPCNYLYSGGGGGGSAGLARAPAAEECEMQLENRSPVWETSKYNNITQSKKRDK